MKLESRAFKNEELIPKKFTCDGEDINPPLTILDVPKNAKSLVLMVEDPDAPAGLWVHWMLWDLDPKITEIKEGNVPDGAMLGRTSFGEPKYGGPCPPDGEHRYFFKIYALDTVLGLSPESDKETLEEAMVGHVLDKAELMGVYSR